MHERAFATPAQITLIRAYGLGCRHAHLAAQKRRMGHPPQGLPAAVDRVSITCQRLRAGAWRAAAADRRWGVYQRRVLVLRQVWI